MCFINKGNMYKFDDTMRKIPLDYHHTDVLQKMLFCHLKRENVKNKYSV